MIIFGINLVIMVKYMSMLHYHLCHDVQSTSWRQIGSHGVDKNGTYIFIKSKGTSWREKVRHKNVRHDFKVHHNAN